MSEVPYYLKSNVDNAPKSSEIFNFSVTTSLPEGVIWDPPTTSVWEGLSETASETFSSVTGAASSAFDAVTDKAIGVGDKLLGTLAKYFVIVAGAIILLVFIAGKSGALKISAVKVGG